MKAALLRAPGVIECVEAPMPAPGPGQVLVRMLCASLCGSDLHHVFMPLLGQGFPTPCGWPGHEGVGEVVESRAPGFAPGQPVLTVPDIQHAACFADFQVLGAQHLIGLDGAGSSERLVLAQPLGTVIYSLKRFLPAEIPGTVLVLGQGSIGLFFTWLLKQRGVAQVIASEPEAKRRALARRFGADAALDPARDAVVDAVFDLTGGRGAPLVIEVAGTDETRVQAVDAVALDGRVGLFGLPERDEMARFPINLFFRKRVTMMSNYGAQGEAGHASFREALALVTGGRIDVAPLISHRLPLDEIDATFRMAERRERGVVKAMVTFD
jgi:L-iditol 2-dehydrogenase